MTSSSVFFCTVRPAAGFCVEESFNALEDWLRKKATAFVCAVEKQKSAKHVHFCFKTSSPIRRDSLKRSLTSLLGKFYLNFQLDVKVALTEGCFFYTIKDGEICFSNNADDMLGYINDDHERSLAVVNENAEYKHIVLKFAFDNRKHWLPYFKQFVLKYKVLPTIKEFQFWIFETQGKPPPSYFRLKFEYDGLCQTILRTSNPQKACRSYEEAFEDFEVPEEALQQASDIATAYESDSSCESTFSDERAKRQRLF